MTNFSGLLPIQGTEIARQWDHLYWFLTALSVVFFVFVIGAMVWFMVVYRERPGHKAAYIEHNTPLEIVWTVVPTILVLIIFAWGYVIYRNMVTPPTDAIEIRVLGKQWQWNFQYADGRVTTDKVYVPVNQAVKLIMTSEDVLHSFFIPNFRVKQDVVPGMYTSVWFKPTVAGRHQVYCAEYCGGDHSGMLAEVVALEPEQWKQWTRGKDPMAGAAAGGGGVGLSLVEQGRQLTQTKGCVACHSEDGSAKVGPSYKGLFGGMRKFADGSEAKADENYIRESIENPQAKVVTGFPPAMPTFKGQISETEMNAVIAFIKSLK